MLRLKLPDVILVLGSSGYLGAHIVKSIRPPEGGTVLVTADLADADYCVDLRQPSIHEEIWKRIYSDYGPSSLGLVVCTGHSPFTPTLERTHLESIQTFEANVMIPVWALNALARVCLSTTPIKATVVLISSVYGRYAPDFEIYEHLNRTNSEVYGATKAGVDALARYYAKRFASESIRVNCVAPGGVIDTSLHSAEFQLAYGRRVAAGRMVSRREVSSTVQFLLADASSGINGQTIHVDGGYGL